MRCKQINFTYQTRNNSEKTYPAFIEFNNDLKINTNICFSTFLLSKICMYLFILGPNWIFIPFALITAECNIHLHISLQPFPLRRSHSWPPPLTFFVGQGIIDYCKYIYWMHHGVIKCITAVSVHYGRPFL